MQLRRVVISLLFILVLAQPSPARADSPTYHTVAWGETLYSIARLFGLAPQSIAAANGLTLNSWVYAGQVLKIPIARTSSPAPAAPQRTPSGIYTVRAGDTLTSLAQQFGVSVDALAAANNIPANGFVYTGWQLKIPAAAAPAGAPGASPAGTARTPASAYIVQPGDNLFRIALRYGTTTQAIALANNLSTYFVYSGQRLVIPGSAAASTDAPVSGPNVSAPANTTSGALNVRVNGLPLYKQQQTLTCEEAAAAMALRGALSEARLVSAMPRSDNPFEGIRGSTNYPLYGGLTNYGTYAQGLQKGLAALGRSSTVLYGQAYPDFKSAVISNLQAGSPVIWWTTWRQTYQRPASVTTSAGSQITLVPYEHSVLVIAANDSGITYNDPYDASVRFTSWSTFQRVSAYFNNMALVIQ